ncbi:autotransporter domain-containing protein [Aliidiomarina soli]|uniref:Uncharacterized protein n=1 Tax=Aliidiomarina soli TaxID=1928574 RepID=A0A432WL86_9GAMM|nr:autotransporter domain-containing protein [Aliidiomarina soli]RUO34467.1 hypothetical protein CWE14_00160 [Aliidiomarina soli]
MKAVHSILACCLLCWAWLPGTAAAAQPAAGLALEVQGLQSRYTDIAAEGDWIADDKFNEVGLALRWQWHNDWLVEATLSRGGQLRYLRETGSNDDGATEYETRQGRTYGWSVGAGKRFWVSEYFSWVTTVGYMQRGIRSPDFSEPTLNSSRTVEHNAMLGIKAEYRVLQRLSVSLNFNLLSSGERQQGLGIAYYFF